MVDVGGTTTDVGILVSGFPREASVAVHIGGVRTNFRMPTCCRWVSVEVPSCVSRRERGNGLGGSRKRRLRAHHEGHGVRWLEVTATDIAVAGGLVDVGDRSAVTGLDGDLVAGALHRIRDEVARTVDRMKTSSEPVRLVLVGGGSILLGDFLPGVSEVIRPDNFAVANAIGAAIAQVGGEVDRIYALGRHPAEDAWPQPATRQPTGGDGRRRSGNGRGGGHRGSAPRLPAFECGSVSG